MRLASQLRQCVDGLIQRKMNWLILIYFTRPHHHPDQGSTVSGWPYRLHPWGPSTKAKLLTCILRAARVGWNEMMKSPPRDVLDAA